MRTPAGPKRAFVLISQIEYSAASGARGGRDGPLGTVVRHTGRAAAWSMGFEGANLRHSTRLPPKNFSA